jgi:ABC-type lipoprotein release transport system permease subunit
MVVGVLRNLRARAGRSILTIAGIAIGILALVVVGSLAERLGTIVTRSTSLNNGAIFAMATRGDIMASDQTDRVNAAMAKIRTFRGVRAIVPEVILPYSLASSRESSRFGPPSLIFGFPPQARQFSNGAISVRYGRDLRDDDVRAAVIGADFAASAHATLGTTISLYGNSFHVVGVIDKSFTIFDAAVVVPFAQAQALMRQIVPPMAISLPKASASALMVIARRYGAHRQTHQLHRRTASARSRGSRRQHPLDHADLRCDHFRGRAHRAARRRVLDRQHDDDRRHRTHPRDRHSQSHRRPR